MLTGLLTLPGFDWQPTLIFFSMLQRFDWQTDEDKLFGTLKF